MLSDLLTTPLALGSLGPWEMIVILAVALLLFGHRLPDMARSAGKAVSEFKRGMADMTAEAAKPVENKEDTKALAAPTDVQVQEKKA